MSVEAFAVEEKGRILAHTIRASAADSKVAAAHRVKIKGARWEALAATFGWRVVRVRVMPIDPSARPKPAPPPAPRPAPKAAALVGGSDARPIRLNRKR